MLQSNMLVYNMPGRQAMHQEKEEVPNHARESTEIEQLSVEQPWDQRHQASHPLIALQDGYKLTNTRVLRLFYVEKDICLPCGNALKHVNWLYSEQTWDRKKALQHAFEHVQVLQPVLQALDFCLPRSPALHLLLAPQTS